MATTEDAEAVQADRTTIESTIDLIAHAQFVEVTEYREPGDDVQHDPRLLLSVDEVALIAPRQVGQAWGARIYTKSQGSFRTVETLEQLQDLLR